MTGYLEYSIIALLLVGLAAPVMFDYYRSRNKNQPPGPEDDLF